MEPQYNRDDRRKRLARHVIYVPLVEVDSDDSFLTDKDALAVWRDLRSNRSQIPDRVHQIVGQVEKEVVQQLNRLDQFGDDSVRYVVTPQELHGIIARAAIRGSAQTAIDIGSRLEDAADLDRLLDPEEQDREPGTE